MSLQSSVNQALGSVAIAKNAISYAEMSKKMGERALKEKETLLQNKLKNNDMITKARVAAIDKKAEGDKAAKILVGAAKGEAIKKVAKANADVIKNGGK